MSHKHRNSYATKMNVVIGILIAIIVIAVIGMFVSIRRMRVPQADTTIGTESETGAYRNITVDGVDYSYNTHIKTILYVGIDSEGIIEPQQGYGTAPRSDTIMLLALDELSGRLNIISINRNTMTPIQQFDVGGDPLSKNEKQLAYAFEEGDGGKVSCENVRTAVSELLGGIPVDQYIVMNRDSIPYFNELVGGVTVTVPDDSLAAVDPIFTAGNLVTLDDKQTEEFVRSRDTDVAFSNSARMERQKVYVNAFVGQMEQSVLEDPEGTWNMINDDGMTDYMLTSITRNQYLDLVNIFKKLDLSNPNFYIPEGEDDNSNELEEYYINEDSLQNNLLEIFYLAD